MDAGRRFAPWRSPTECDPDKQRMICAALDRQRPCSLPTTRLTNPGAASTDDFAMPGASSVQQAEAVGICDW
jgi:hypothetical protein